MFTAVLVGLKVCNEMKQEQGCQWKNSKKSLKCVRMLQH